MYSSLNFPLPFNFVVPLELLTDPVPDPRHPGTGSGS
jgi:hypothetical protein